MSDLALDHDEDLPEDRPARQYLWQKPPSPDPEPLPVPRRRRVRLNSHAEVLAAMRGICVAMVRGELERVDGNAQIRALKAYADAMRDGGLEPQVKAIIRALTARGIMK